MRLEVGDVGVSDSFLFQSGLVWLHNESTIHVSCELYTGRA